ESIEEGVGAQVFAWLDNGWVTGITTLHGPPLDDSDYEIRNRRRPRITSKNTTLVRPIFGQDARRELPIPKIIDDYNYNMNGVDRADQLRSSFTSHRAGRRTWLPLFWFLINICKVNSYILYSK